MDIHQLHGPRRGLADCAIKRTVILSARKNSRNPIEQSRPQNSPEILRISNLVTVQTEPLGQLLRKLPIHQLHFGTLKHNILMRLIFDNSVQFIFGGKSYLNVLIPGQMYDLGQSTRQLYPVRIGYHQFNQLPPVGMQSRLDRIYPVYEVVLVLLVGLRGEQADILLGGCFNYGGNIMELPFNHLLLGRQSQPLMIGYMELIIDYWVDRDCIRDRSSRWQLGLTPPKATGAARKDCPSSSSSSKLPACLCSYGGSSTVLSTPFCQQLAGNAQYPARGICVCSAGCASSQFYF